MKILRNLSKTVIIFCCLFSISYADTGFGVSTVGTLSSLTAAELSVEPVDIDLGAHIPGYSFSSSFTITNPGGETLTGTISEAVNWITSLNPASFSLNYNDSVTVEFSGSFPDETEEFSTNISITSNGGNESVLVFGNSKLGSISGYVLYDETPISNQKVELRDADYQIIRSEFSDDNGIYTFNDLPTGVYSLITSNRPAEYRWGDFFSIYLNHMTEIFNVDIRLYHDIVLLNPEREVSTSSPVYFEWQSKPNESLYRVGLVNEDNLVYDDYLFSTNNFTILLDPGYYYFWVKSYNAQDYKIGRSVDRFFKVDIPVISDPGTISSNTIWSGEVYLTNDVTVEEGVTLTIEPGTSIYIKYTDQSEWPITIHVYGEIISDGTEDKPIKFIPDPSIDDTYAQLWEGIVLYENAFGSFKYNFISCTNSGIKVNNCSPIIHHSTFHKTHRGIDINGNNSNPDIQYNDFFTDEYDIHINSSDITNPVIRNNNFFMHTMYGFIAIGYFNSSNNHQLDCRWNYWGEPLPITYPDERFEGSVIYEPAFTESVGSNSWSAEFVDWDIPEYENGGNNLQKVSANQDSVLLSLMSNTIGPRDGHYFSLGYGGYITYDLGTNNSVIDSTGPDIYIYETIVNDSSVFGSEYESAAIYLGNSVDGPWELAAEIDGSSAIDIDSLSENQYRYLKIQDRSFGDSTITSPGFDLDAIRIKNNVTITGLNDDNQFNYASGFILKQNYPNPFNPSTNIIFNIPKPSDVKIEVFNSLGQKVSVIINKKMNAGIHTVKFDAGNLSSGIYYYKIKAGEFIAVKKMLLMR